MSNDVCVLTDSSFGQEVLQADQPVLVDFWAQWCGPCKLIGPILEELAAEFKDKIKICKLDTDEQQGSPSSYNVSAIPTLILFKDGKEAERMVGAKSKNEIKTLLEKNS